MDVLLPTPPRREDGGVPVAWPHRTGWHTDQSYRRPPPDVSLFYAAKPVPPGTDGVHQGQTLYCDATAAYNALPAEGKARARLHYRFVLLLIQFIPDLQNRIGASNP